MIKIRKKYILLSLFLSALLLLTISLYIFLLLHPLYVPQTHMIDLAKSFLQGKLYLQEPLNPSVALGDVALFHGKHFIYFGPAPAVLLIPFVLLYHISSQWILLLLLTPLSALVLYSISQSQGLDARKSMWITTAFFYGTPYLFLFLVNITAYYIQIVGISFVLFALYYFIVKRHYVLSGTMIGVAALTRQILYVSVIFFIVALLQEKIPRKFVMQRLGQFLLPVLLSFILYALYNYVRFGSFSDTGYAYNITTQTYSYFKKALDIGFFSPAHIPGNLYFLFFKFLDPIRQNDINYVLKFPFFKANPWGLGIFFTSPFFFFCFGARMKDKYILPAFITTLVLCVLILFYFNTGYWQYGYRYALDFYPFLFLILIARFKEHFPLSAKFLIMYSIFFNAFFMFSIWGAYPLLPPSLWP